MIGLTFPLPALFAPMTAAPSAEPAVQAPARHVVFSHGQESGPWGRKISALAEVARSEGYLAHSVRSEEHTSDSSHSQISYAVFCLKKKRGASVRQLPGARCRTQ